MAIFVAHINGFHRIKIYIYGFNNYLFSFLTINFILLTMDAMQLPWFFENIARIMFVNGGMMVRLQEICQPILSPGNR